MNLKNSLHDVLNRDMNRREFLAHTGAAVLAMVGIAGLLKAVSEFGKPKRSNGYGSSAYGGGAEARITAFKAKNKLS